ncbi:hypothetical protein ACLKA7_008853 [Drosophila subpalustris]
MVIGPTRPLQLATDKREAISLVQLCNSSTKLWKGQCSRCWSSKIHMERGSWQCQQIVCNTKHIMSSLVGCCNVTDMLLLPLHVRQLATDQTST